MSQQQYTAIQKTRLTDLLSIPIDSLLIWLADKPDFMQKGLIQARMKNKR